MSTPARVKLSPDGPEISRLVYGVWRLLDDPEGHETPRVQAKIEACLEAGITTFDHADIYGGYGCEAAFGAALRASPTLRDRIEIVTKCGIMLVDPARPENHIKHYDYTHEHITRSVERSLQNLATEVIDVLLLHRPSPLLDLDEVAEAFRALRAQGKVRHFGVSNFTPAQLDALSSRVEAPLVTNQVEIHPLRLDAFLDGTLDQCQKLRIAPMAWSPLGGGRVLQGRGEGGESGGGGAEARVQYTLVELARAKHATPEQIVYAWLLHHPARIVPVIGTNRLERITAAAQALSLKLDTQEWFALWSAATGAPVP